jgi:hypothetical protein
MTPSSPFEITRRDPSINASAKFTPPAGFDPVPRGFALGAHATDPESFDLAQHNTFIGHLTRFVRVGGLTITDRVFGVTSETPVGVEAPFVAGQEVSVEKAREIEAEGSAYLVQSGTRSILTGTGVGAGLSFFNGLLGLAQAGEQVNYRLTANNLTPNAPGSLRIRAEAQ